MAEMTHAAAVSTSKSLIANSRWNIVAFLCVVVSNIVTVPYVVLSIGMTAFGRAGLVIAICAPMMIIGTVLGQGLVSRKSARLGEGNIEGAAWVTDAALRLCMLASFASWLVLVIAGPWLASALETSVSAPQNLQLAFLICASAMFARQHVLIAQSVCLARQNFPVLTMVAAFSAAADIASTLLITSAFPTVDGYLASMATGTAIAMCLWLWVLRRETRWRAIVGADRHSEVEELLKFGKWQGVSQLSGTFANQIDRYLLGAMGPVAIVGQYNVASRLAEAAFMGAMKGSEVLFPHFGRLSSRSPQERGRHFLAGSWIVGTFAAMLFAPLLPLAEPLLKLWVGAGFTEESAIILRTLVLCGLIGISSNVFFQYAMGIGRNEPVAWILVLYSVLAVIFSVVLLRTFGPMAAGGGALAAGLVRLGAVLFTIRRKYLEHLAPGALIATIVLPVATGAILGLGAHRTWAGDVDGWPQLVMFYAFFAVGVFAAIVTVSALTRTGREIVLRTFTVLRPRLGS